MTTQTAPRLALAPLDALGREIQEVLSVVRPRGPEEPEPAYVGYADAAAEAYFHLARESEPSAALSVVKHGTGASSHWWLVGEDDRIIDLTLSPANRRSVNADPAAAYPYEEGRGAMFRTGASKPSKRATAVIELVRARRRS
jgi:hypothetical protein